MYLSCQAAGSNVNVTSSLMATIGGLHHQKKIRPIRHERFHIAHIETALMRFTEESRTGKIVVVYEDAEIPVKVVCSPFSKEVDLILCSIPNHLSKPSSIPAHRTCSSAALEDWVNRLANGWWSKVQGNSSSFLDRAARSRR